MLEENKVELKDEELEKVSGGTGDAEGKYSVGDEFCRYVEIRGSRYNEYIRIIPKTSATSVIFSYSIEIWQQFLSSGNISVSYGTIKEVDIDNKYTPCTIPSNVSSCG